MDIGVLGPLVVTVDRHEVPVGAAKQRAVLAVLVLRRNEMVTTETLVDDVWDGRPPATAVKIIHGYVSQLRKSLGDGVLETGSGGYRLCLAPEALDTTRFEGLAEQGRAALAGGDPDASAALLQEALALWRGAPLAEFRSHGFAANEIARLEELRLMTLECRFEADLALGNHAAAIPELQALTRKHPLRENLCRLLMLALYRTGRQADALAVYRNARAVLVEELGLEPGDALQRLEAAILVHEPALDMPAPARPRQPNRVLRTRDPAALDIPMDSGQSLRERDRRAEHAPRPGRRRSGHPARRPVAFLACASLITASVLVLVHNQGASGNLATALSADSVGFVGRQAAGVSNQVMITGAPTAIAVQGPALWVVEPTEHTLTRVDTISRSVVQTIPVGSNPSGIVVGGGSIWVANHDDDTVSRISPDTNAVVETMTVGSGPGALADGYGSVWVTNSDDRTLTRIDEATGEVAATIDTGAVGRGIVVGGDSVWVTDEAGGRIVGVDPATNTVSSTAVVGNGPTGITYGNRALWVVNALDGTVSRLDTATLAVDSTIPISGGPSEISFGDDAVWVSAEFTAQLVRIDPEQAVIIGSTSLGGRPEGLAATDTGVWVSTQASGTSHRGGRLVVTGDVTSIDPSVGDMPPEALDLAYDTLTSLRSANGSAGSQIVPDLAAALPQPTAAGTTYTFHLRPGIRYSNGSPLQAADFRRGLTRLLQLNETFAPSFAHVVGADCVGRLTCDLTTGVQVEGTSTLIFRLSTPDPRFLEELTYLVPIPDGTPMSDVGTSPVPGTGPYAIQRFVRGQLLTFQRNRFFRVWSAAARPDGYPDEVVYRNAGSDDDALHQVTAGQADLVQLTGGSAALTRLAAEHPGQVHAENQQATIFVFLNTRAAPFDNVDVRRALNFAVDRERVADLYGAALARPTCQMIPPTTTGYRPYCPYTAGSDSTGQWRAPDFAQAQSLVDDSGTKGQPVVMWTSSNFLDEADDVSGILDQLGYPTSVHEVADPGDYFHTLDATPGAQAGMYGWFGNPLAVDALATVTCNFEPNPAHFCYPQIDAQIRQLANVEPSDPARARDLAAGLDRAITDQAPWVPLFTPRTVDVTSLRVGNVQTVRGQLLLDQLWVQ